MKSVYIVAGVVAVIAWLAIGLVIARGPQPEIVVPAEKLWTVGPLNITNTLLTSWFVMIVMIIMAVVATRGLKLLPSGYQNFIEAAVGYLVDQIVEIAGDKNGRRFFTVVATLFLYILMCNWFGLLPFFNAIGKTEDVGHKVFEEISSPHPNDLKLSNGVYSEDHKFGGWKSNQSGNVVLVKSQAKAIDFTVLKGETPGQAMDRYIVFLAHNYAGFAASEAEQDAPTPDMVKAAAAALQAKPDSAPQLLTGEGEATVKSPVLGETISGVDFSHSQKMTLVVPFFRGVFSDVNNTLALAIVAFVIIEVWGFQSLGFGYLKKFFNFSSPINVFVGLLELLSEFIRIISFAFRLFGNIFAGEVLVLMLTFLMPFLFVDIIYGLELFVGFIQAAVFALLTLVFGVMAVEHHDESEHDAGHGAEGEAHHPAGAAQAH